MSSSYKAAPFILMAPPLISDMALITDIRLTEISIGAAVVTGMAVTTEVLAGIMAGEADMVATETF